jgi:hypothetical protein
MASITTILGTDSVSSSRIVINNNFAALNAELADISALFNTTSQTLTLTGLITGGTLKVNNGSIDTFKVNNSDAEVNVPIEFNQDVTLTKGLMHSVTNGITTLPSINAYNYTTYILDATAPAFASPSVLADANDGQLVTFIVSGTPQTTGSDPAVSPVIEFDTTNIAGTSVVEVGQDGSITFIYNGNTSEFHVVSVMNATVTY